MRRPVVVGTAVVIALSFSACEDPYERSDPPASRPTGRAPRVAVEAFCRTWSTWSWQSLAEQQRRLAGLATGSLAQDLAAEAAKRPSDETQRRDQTGSRGGVVAIDMRGDRAVCVTLEEPITDGRPDPEGTRHHVYRAQLRLSRGRWAVSSWEPQP